ncbi:hypothetical protein HW537_05555 [Asaia siamensis]
MTIIFEGSDLIVHETEGVTDYAVITFGGADQEHLARDTFFAEKPLVHNSIKGIGVTTRQNLWFLSPEAEAVARLINDRLAHISNRIIIGYSMGAHAAMTWSKKLNATTVFSMSPKYSVDPDMCFVEKDFIEKYFRPELGGMHIQDEKLSGNIFIAYDPYHSHDTSHVNAIIEKVKYPHIHAIKSFFSNHDVPRAFTGRKKFLRLVEALAYGSVQDVHRVFSYERRHSLHNLSALFRHYIAKQPERAFKLITSDPVFNAENLKPIFADALSLGRLSFNLSQKGRMKEASICRNLPFLQTCFRSSLTKAQAHQAEFSSFVDAPPGYHGDLLAYDIANRTFIGQDLLAASTLRPFVTLAPCAGTVLLKVMIGSESLYLYEEEEQILMSDKPRPSGFSLERSSNGFHHHIKSRIGYLSSLPAGQMSLNAAHRMNWEEFSVPTLTAS